ncbi:MFS transporter [Streptomyces sp. SID7909]|nr:MFS transporter [Streptomyces sp. SID7909]
MSRFKLLSLMGSAFAEPGVQRTFVVSTFVATIGGGIILPISTLYFIKIVGLSAAQVGLAFTVSGLLAIPLSVPAGALADRIGPRRVMMATFAGHSLVGVSYLFVQNFWMLLAVQMLSAASLAANYPASGAMLRRIGGDQAVTIRSKIRVVANLGVSLGSLIAGVGIQIDTATSYRVLALAFTLTQVASLAMLFRLPNYQPLPRPQKEADGSEGAPSKRIALRDKAFLAYSLVGGAMAIQNMILEIMIAVWIVNYTDAPGWAVTVAFVLNTALVVMLQVRIGAKIQSITDGGTALRRAGFALLLGCAAMSLMAGVPAWAALLLLVVGMVLLTLGEIYYVSGTFAFEFGMPPAYAQGQYQGVAGAVSGAAKAAAPALLLGVALSLGSTGWIGVGAFLLLLGLTGPAIARWGERTRPSGETTEAQTAATDASTGSASPATDVV